MDGTPIDRDKMLTVGFLSARTRTRVKEGRDSEGRYKATTDELNNTVTERSADGAPGVSNRQDVTVRPETIRMKLSHLQGSE